MEISLARALLELKTLDKRIEKQITELNVCGLQKRKHGNKELRTNKTLEEFNTEAKSAFQSVQDLMTHRNKLKVAITIANATTKVNINNEEMTISAAIDRKNFLGYMELFLTKLKAQKNSCDKEMLEDRVFMEKQLDQMLLQNLGKDKKASPDDYKAISEPLILANEALLVDPINCGDEIKKLSEKIENFKKEVDITLSEVNARTTITV